MVKKENGKKAKGPIGPCNYLGLSSALKLIVRVFTSIAQKERDEALQVACSRPEVLHKPYGPSRGHV